MEWLHRLLLCIPADGPTLRFGLREFWVVDGGLMYVRDQVIRWEWRKPGYKPVTFRNVLLRFEATGED